VQSEAQIARDSECRGEREKNERQTEKMIQHEVKDNAENE
jgi:hypothetical protein